MKKHLRYLSYVVRHKYFVFVAGRKTKAPLWNLILHDRSKFKLDEWLPYAEWFYGPKAGTHKNERLDEFNAFMKSIKLHYSRNPHHWQFWVQNDKLGEYLHEMPEVYVREMVADWMGAGRAITGSWDLSEWYAKNKDKQTMHAVTQFRVAKVLGEQGYEL